MSLKKTFYTFVDVVRPIYISVFVDVGNVWNIAGVDGVF